MTKDDIVYLNHIMDSISKIEDFTEDLDEKEFNESELVQAAVIRHIEIIGDQLESNSSNRRNFYEIPVEAAKQLSDETRKKYPQIPWTDIAGMRDKLIHGYFGVDINAVWNTVRKDIPQLKKDVKEIMNEITE